MSVFIDLPELPRNAADQGAVASPDMDLDVLAAYDDGEPVLVQVNWFAARVMLPATWTESILATTDLRVDSHYQQAEYAAAEGIERFLDAIAGRSSWASPTMVGPLSCNLATLYVGGKQAQSPPRTAPPMGTTLNTQPTFAASQTNDICRQTRMRGTLQLAWRLFRNARSLMIAREHQKEAIIEAVLSLEIGLKDSLAVQAERQLRTEVNKATLNQLLNTYPRQVLGTELVVALPTVVPIVQGLIDDRNAIVHRGKEPTGNWDDLRRQLEAVRHALRWLETYERATPQ
jgi:hypothetical protein